MDWRVVRRAEGRARQLIVLATLTAIVAASCSAPTSPTGPVGSTVGQSTGTGPSGPTLEPYSPGPSPTPEDPATLYARIEGQVEQIRGLAELSPVTPRLLDQAGLAAQLQSRFDAENPPAVVAAEQALYRDLGLIPRTVSLKVELLKLLTSQVAGFYRPTTKELYVLSETGTIGPSQQVAFAHEFDHALQDQHFDLTKLGIDTPDQGDRALARLSVAEGDATLLMSQWAQQNLTPLQTLQLLQESADPTQTAILASMPPFLRDELLFPYTSGLTFIEALWGKGGWAAVNDAYTNPPNSTAEILHPERYLAHVEPVTVALPADIASRLGPGWSIADEDTLGEFGLREWLAIVAGADGATATDAASAWTGDRVIAFAGPAGAWGVVLATRWTDATAAAAFRAAAQGAAAHLPAVTVTTSGAGVTVLIGSDATTLSRLTTIPLGG